MILKVFYSKQFVATKAIKVTIICLRRVAEYSQLFTWRRYSDATSRRAEPRSQINRKTVSWIDVAACRHTAHCGEEGTTFIPRSPSLKLFHGLVYRRSSGFPPNAGSSTDARCRAQLCGRRLVDDGHDDDASVGCRRQFRGRRSAFNHCRSFHSCVLFYVTHVSSPT